MFNDTATTEIYTHAQGEEIVPCLLQANPQLRRAIRDNPVNAALTARIKDHMVAVADLSLAPLSIPPAKVARMNKETGELMSESDFPTRMYFATILSGPMPKEGTDYRMWLPPNIRVAGAVIEAATQLVEEGIMRQTKHGHMLRLARGKPGADGDMWPATPAIPDGHKGLYLDNLEYKRSDAGIRRGLPQLLQIEDLEEGEEEGPVESESIMECRDRLEDLLTRRRGGIWIPAEVYGQSKIENVLTSTLHPAACDARLWIPKHLLNERTLFKAVKQAIREDVFKQELTHLGLTITLAEDAMQP